MLHICFNVKMSTIDSQTGENPVYNDCNIKFCIHVGHRQKWAVKIFLETILKSICLKFISSVYKYNRIGNLTIKNIKNSKKNLLYTFTKDFEQIWHPIRNVTPRKSDWRLTYILSEMCLRTFQIILAMPVHLADVHDNSRIV